MQTGIDPFWHAAGIALVGCLFVVRRWVASRHIVLICIFSLAGVALHEMAHFFVGVLCRANPCGFNLIPERSPDGGWTMGSVEFERVTAFNAVPIAFAPLLLLGLAYEAFVHWPLIFPYPTLPSTLGLYAAMYLLCYEALPSPQDLRIACNWRSVMLYGSVAGGVLIWLSMSPHL
jgi:hypothetical protein